MCAQRDGDTVPFLLNDWEVCNPGITQQQWGISSLPWTAQRGLACSTTAPQCPPSPGTSAVQLLKYLPARVTCQGADYAFLGTTDATVNGTCSPSAELGGDCSLDGAFAYTAMILGCPPGLDNSFGSDPHKVIWMLDSAPDLNQPSAVYSLGNAYAMLANPQDTHYVLSSSGQSSILGAGCAPTALPHCR